MSNSRQMNPKYINWRRFFWGFSGIFSTDLYSLLPWQARLSLLSNIKVQWTRRNPRTWWLEKWQRTWSQNDSINLRDSKVEEFYNAVVEFYKAGLDYLLVKMPYNDELLDKAKVADVSMWTKVSVSDLMYFVDKFPVLLPSGCTKDALELRVC